MSLFEMSTNIASHNMFKNKNNMVIRKINNKINYRLV